MFNVNLDDDWVRTVDSVIRSNDSTNWATTTGLGKWNLFQDEIAKKCLMFLLGLGR